MVSDDNEAEADIEMDFEHTPVAAPLTNEDSSRKMCCDSLWWGQYCCVPMCHHSSGEQAERMHLENSFILSQILLQKKKEHNSGLERFGGILAQIL